MLPAQSLSSAFASAIALFGWTSRRVDAEQTGNIKGVALDQKVDVTDRRHDVLPVAVESVLPPRRSAHTTHQKAWLCLLDLQVLPCAVFSARVFLQQRGGLHDM